MVLDRSASIIPGVSDGEICSAAGVVCGVEDCAGADVVFTDAGFVSTAVLVMIPAVGEAAREMVPASGVCASVGICADWPDKVCVAVCVRVIGSTVFREATSAVRDGAGVSDNGAMKLTVDACPLTGPDGPNISDVGVNFDGIWLSAVGLRVSVTAGVAVAEGVLVRVLVTAGVAVGCGLGASVGIRSITGMTEATGASCPEISWTLTESVSVTDVVAGVSSDSF